MKPTSNLYDLSGPTTNLPSLLLISASAGTGKTFSITDLAVRWMLETLSVPEELLMVTFSRSAARELKAKLRERVESWREALSSYSSGQPIDSKLGVDELRVQSVLSSINLEKALGHIEAILSNLDEVSARTIHSFVGSISESEANNGVGAEGLTARAVAEELIWTSTTATGEILAALENSGDTANLTTRMEVLTKRTVSAVKAVSSAGGVGPTRARFASSSRSTLQEVVENAFQRIETMRFDEGITTFDGIVKDIADQLEHQPDELISRIRHQFKLVMIDEFQDTDKLQWSIFYKLFRDPQFPNATKMVLVGDPKQAIYGFRGGDVEVFRSQESEILSALVTESKQVATLDRNWRSTEPVVAGYNFFFKFAESQGWSLENNHAEDTGSPSGGYVPVFAEKVGEGRFEIRQVLEAVTKAQEKIEEDVCREVISLIEKMKANPQWGQSESDIAILCRRTGHLASIGRALQRHGVVTVNVRVDNVFASEAARQVRTLLWILDEPSNPKRSRLLSSLWFETRESDLEPMLELFEKRSFASVHRHLLAGPTVNRVLLQPEGERKYTDLEHLCELIDIEFPGRSNPLIIRRWLEERHSEVELGEDESAQRRIESDANAVRLTTAHSSKGLEWKHVLIPDLHYSRPKVTIDSWTDREGRVVDVGSVAGQSTVGVAAEREIDEIRRLIYVALTRGVQTVIAWSPNKVGKATDPKSYGPWIQLVNSYAAAEELEADLALWRLAFPGRPLALPTYKVVGAEGQELTPPSTSVPKTREKPVYVPATVVDEAIRRWSYTSLHLAEVLSESGLSTEVSAGFDAGAEAESKESSDTTRVGRGLFGDDGGASLGNALHRFFEHTVGAPESNEEYGRQVLRDAYAEFGLKEDPDKYFDLCQTLMTFPLGAALQNKSLADFAGQRGVRVSNEMRFTLPLTPGSGNSRIRDICQAALEHDPVGPFVEFFRSLKELRTDGDALLQGFLTGSLDLILDVGDTEQPKLVVVDYKSNSLARTNTFSRESLAQEMSVSGYPMQALLYTVALYRYLRLRRGVEAEKALGGVLYYYLRGALVESKFGDGLMYWDLPPALTIAVSNILDGVAE
jgi:exodeoxyribonuclease V beta subunit